MLPQLVTEYGSAQLSITDMAMTGDGRQVLTAANSSVILWDVRSQREVRRFPDASGSVWHFALAHRSALMVTGGDGGPLLLWNVDTGEQLGHLPDPSGLGPRGWVRGVVALRFTPDDARVVAVVNERQRPHQPDTAYAWIWQTRSRERPRRVPLGPSASLASLSADGRLAAITSGNNNSVYDCDTGAVVSQWSDPEVVNNRPQALAISPQGDAVALVYEFYNDVSGLYDTRTGKRFRPLPPRDYEQVAFSADGRTLLTLYSESRSVEASDPQISDLVQSSRKLHELAGAVSATGTPVPLDMFDRDPKPTIKDTIFQQIDLASGQTRSSRTIGLHQMFGTLTRDSGVVYPDSLNEGGPNAAALIGTLAGTAYILNGGDHAVGAVFASQVVPVNGLAVDAGMTQLVVETDRASHLLSWDLARGRPGLGFGPLLENVLPRSASTFPALRFSPDGTALHFDDQFSFHTWDAASHAETSFLSRALHGGNLQAVSDDNTQAVVLNTTLPEAGNAAAWRRREHWEHYDLWEPHSWTSTGRWFELVHRRDFTGEGLGPGPVRIDPQDHFVIGEFEGALCTVVLPPLLDFEKCRPHKPEDDTPPYAISDSALMALTGEPGHGLALWSIVGEHFEFALLHRFTTQQEARVVALSEDGSWVAGGSNNGQLSVEHWQPPPAPTEAPRRGALAAAAQRGPAGKRPEKTRWVIQAHEGQIEAAQFFAHGSVLATGGLDGAVRLWDTPRGRLLATLFVTPEGQWTVVDPTGHFDSSDLDDTHSFHWSMPDDPLRALPPELFVRDYFEPKLLPRILFAPDHKANFRAVTGLDRLNRAQPLIQPLEIKPSDVPGMVDVTVSVDPGEYATADRKKHWTSDPFDLRLFRDGQLIAESPPPQSSVIATGETSSDADWQRVAALTTKNDPRVAVTGARRTVTFQHILLPHRSTDRPVEISAYAFNKSRVRTQIVSEVTAPNSTATAHKIAYVIAVGVAEYGDYAWDLPYAAKDANDMIAALTSPLHQAGYTPSVIPLTAELGVNHADKDSIRAAVEHIAQVSTPDDLVIFYFAGHGFSATQSSYYLIPSDARPSSVDWRKPSATALTRMISTGNLAQWLGNISAAEIVFILDACESAASIEAGDFKAGPLGSFSFGQLAYDKRMRVISASQSNEAARELGGLIGNGVLTYVLACDGLNHARAVADDGSGHITLESWLRYGETAVPLLLKRIGAGTFNSQDACDPPTGTTDSTTLPVGSVQKPEYFDFARNDHLPVVLKAGANP